MKILILSDGLSGGGAERVAFDLANSFLELKNEVSIITTVQDKSKAGKTNENGIEIYKIYSNYHERWRAYISLNNYMLVKEVKRIIKKIEPDVVHAHAIHCHLSYASLKIAKKYCDKVFLTAHDVMLFHYAKLVEFINFKNAEIPKQFDYKIGFLKQIKRFKKRYNPLRNIIIKKYLKYVDKIFAVSNSLKDALEQNGIKNVEVVYNGINLSEWKENDRQVKEFKDKYNLNGKKIVFFGGRLSDWKGTKELIQAMERVSREVQNTVLLVSGQENDYTHTISKLAEEKGIKMILTGWLGKEELKTAYYSSDIIVTPSLCLDTFNLMNLEAMACNKPVVTTCFGGATEVVIDNKTGYIVNPLDTDMMSKKIIELLENDEKAREFGEAGHSRAKKFSLSKQAEKYLKYFNA